MSSARGAVLAGGLAICSLFISALPSLILTVVCGDSQAGYGTTPRGMLLSLGVLVVCKLVMVVNPSLCGEGEKDGRGMQRCTKDGHDDGSFASRER